MYILIYIYLFIYLFIYIAIYLFIYLFIYLSTYLFICIRGKKSALVQLFNQQMCELPLSLELKNHILETKSHFTP